MFSKEVMQTKNQEKRLQLVDAGAERDRVQQFL